MTKEEQIFKSRFPEYCAGEVCLSPFFDLFQIGFEEGEEGKEELEKANAELKEQVKEWKALQELYDGKAFKWQGKYGDVSKQLTKAKEIIRELLSCLYSVEYDRVSDLEEAERFLKESK